MTREGAMENPLVSIVTPVLNGRRYLEECIQSVLNQSYASIEQIFVDGGSTDGSLEILKEYQEKHPGRVRLFLEPESNPEEAWNRGLQAAKGEIFGWLGADDTYEPDAIAAVVGFFRANAQAYFVFGGYVIINERGELVEKPRLRDFDLREAINDRCDIPAHSAFFRREVYDKVGPIDTRTRISELDYWIRVGKVFRIHRIDRVLSNFRVHEHSYSGSMAAARAYVRCGYLISRRHGGGIVSPRAARYVRFTILDTLHLYPLINRVYPRIQKLLSGK